MSWVSFFLFKYKKLDIKIKCDFYGSFKKPNRLLGSFKFKTFNFNSSKIKQRSNLFLLNMKLMFLKSIYYIYLCLKRRKLNFKLRIF